MPEEENTTVAEGKPDAVRADADGFGDCDREALLVTVEFIDTVRNTKNDAWLVRVAALVDDAEGERDADCEGLGESLVDASIVGDGGISYVADGRGDALGAPDSDADAETDGDGAMLTNVGVGNAEALGDPE